MRELQVGAVRQIGVQPLPDLAVVPDFSTPGADGKQPFERFDVAALHVDVRDQPRQSSQHDYANAEIDQGNPQGPGRFPEHIKGEPNDWKRHREQQRPPHAATSGRQRHRNDE